MYLGKGIQGDCLLRAFEWHNLCRHSVKETTPDKRGYIKEHPNKHLSLTVISFVIPVCVKSSSSSLKTLRI